MINARTAQVILIVFPLAVLAAVMSWMEYSRIADHRFVSIGGIDREEHKVQRTLFKVASAIHRYRLEKGEVPESLEDLVRYRYLPGLPLNPFTGCPMRAVRLGTEPSPGDYTYVPAYVTGYQDGTVTVRSLREFLLIGYGVKSGKQMGLERNEMFAVRFPTRLRRYFVDAIVLEGRVGLPSPKYGKPGYSADPEGVEELVRRLGL